MKIDLNKLMNYKSIAYASDMAQLGKVKEEYKELLAEVRETSTFIEIKNRDNFIAEGLDFIKKYPNSKDCFEKCGAFLGDYYFIMDNEFGGDENPYTQLLDLLKIAEAKEKNIDLDDDDFYDYDSEMVEAFEDIEGFYKIPSWVNEV